MVDNINDTDIEVMRAIHDGDDGDGVESSVIRSHVGMESPAQSSYRLDKLEELGLAESWREDRGYPLDARIASLTADGRDFIDDVDDPDEEEYDEMEKMKKEIEYLHHQFDSMAKLVGAFQDLLEDDGYDVESYLKARHNNKY